MQHRALQRGMAFEARGDVLVHQEHQIFVVQQGLNEVLQGKICHPRRNARQQCLAAGAVGIPMRKYFAHFLENELLFGRQCAWDEGVAGAHFAHVEQAAVKKQAVEYFVLLAFWGGTKGALPCGHPLGMIPMWLMDIF